MSDCLFCKIVAGEIPSKKVFENDDVFAFEDIHPLAKKHVLFVHRKHTPNLNGLSTIHVGQIFNGIKDYTAKIGLDKTGFRVVTNTGDDAGQTVHHAHFHVLGGEKLGKFGK